MSILQEDINLFISRAQQKISDITWKVAEDSYDSNVDKTDFLLVEDLMIAITVLQTCNSELTVKQEQYIIHHMTGEGQLYKYPYIDLSYFAIKYVVGDTPGQGVPGVSSFDDILGDPYENNRLNNIFSDLYGKLDNKASKIHQHSEADISNLDKYTQAQVNALLNDKANVVHLHSENDISDLDKYTVAEVNSLIQGRASNTDVRLGTKPINEGDIGDLKIQVYRVSTDEIIYMTYAEWMAAISGGDTNAFNSKFNSKFA